MENPPQSVTYDGNTLLFQQASRGISFSHTYELCPPNRRPFGAFRRDRMWDCADFTQPGLINLPVHSVHKGGSSFTGESSRYTTATQMRAIPLGGPSTLGIKNRTYQKPAARGLVQSFIVSCDSRE